MITKVLIVDDDELLLYSLQAIINREPDMEVVAIESQSTRAWETITLVQPDIILLDIEMPELNGLQLLAQIKTHNPELPVILLTTFDEEKYIVQGLAGGASGYLLKTPDFRHLAQNIRDVLQDTFIMPVNIAQKLSNFLQSKQSKLESTIPQSFFDTFGLTKTEQRIIVLLYSHLSNKLIADQLSLSVKTVKNNLTTIYQKLNVQSRAEAIELIKSFAAKVES